MTEKDIFDDPIEPDKKVMKIGLGGQLGWSVRTGGKQFIEISTGPTLFALSASDTRIGGGWSFEVAFKNHYKP